MGGGSISQVWSWREWEKAGVKQMKCKYVLVIVAGHQCCRHYCDCGVLLEVVFNRRKKKKPCCCIIKVLFFSLTANHIESKYVCFWERKKPSDTKTVKFYKSSYSWPMLIALWQFSLRFGTNIFKKMHFPGQDIKKSPVVARTARFDFCQGPPHLNQL